MAVVFSFPGRRPGSVCPLLKIKYKSTTKTASGAKLMVKYEGGCTVETVFNGSKLGIEPYAVEVTLSGELLIMDSMNSNIYRIALPLSRSTIWKMPAWSDARN